MEQQKSRINLTLALFPFVFVAIGVLLVCIWYSELQLHYGSIPVQATIVRCQHSSSDGGGVPSPEYNIYVDYQFDGTLYQDVFWKSFSRKQQIGQAVTVRVNPSQPGRTITHPGEMGGVGILFAVLGVALAFKAIPMAGKPKNRHPIRTDSWKQRLTANKPLMPVIIAFGAVCLLFICLGLFLWPMMHILSIIFGFTTLVLIDYFLL